MSNSQNGSPSKTMSTEPLASSHKIYIESQRRQDVRVAMRAIHLSDAQNGHNGNSHGGEKQAPLTVYDTSGPYTDPNVKTEIRRGLQALRADWIRARGDVEELSAPSYQPPVGKNGHRNGSSTERFPDESRRPILRAKPGRNVSQMHYARQGIITPEM
jgi:phosphomethylpyrimidine synthase